jgi:hypothetical protein
MLGVQDQSLSLGKRGSETIHSIGLKRHNYYKPLGLHFNPQCSTITLSVLHEKMPLSLLPGERN